IGGLGSAVSEFLCETHPTLVKKVGIYDKFGQSGKGDELLEKYELTADKLVSVVKETI
ncbi:MAG: transketolase family protein, partial [Cetobacterium sp.]